MLFKVLEKEQGILQGLTLTNTLAGSLQNPQGLKYAGGWSGGPLKKEAQESLISAKQFSKLPIISVWEILTKEEALGRFKLGEKLIELYTGLIYNGPLWAHRLNHTLNNQVMKRGF